MGAAACLSCCCRSALTRLLVLAVYELFGRYGGIRQIRIGNGAKTRGTAYVVYEDIYDVISALQMLDLLESRSLIAYHAYTRTFRPKTPSTT